MLTNTYEYSSKTAQVLKRTAMVARLKDSHDYTYSCGGAYNCYKYS